MPKRPKLPLPNGYTRKFETTLFTVMSMCCWLLQRIRPESKWRERVKALLDDYPDVSLSSMGFPANWLSFSLWK